MRSNTRIVTVVNPHVARYQTHYSQGFHARVTIYDGHYSRWRLTYSPWSRYGFCGGFYYGLAPVYDIHDHFYNPVVFWLWADSWDDEYYQTWYGSDYYAYSELHAPFYRPGVFFPTEAMRDLALGISGTDAREQANFRHGLNKLVQQLEYKLAGRLCMSVNLGRNDIAITHYQLLDDAVVLEGFVSEDRMQFPFKALIALDDPSGNMVFVPEGEGEPMEGQLDELRGLNARIEQYGGAVSYGEQEQAPQPHRRGH